MGVKRCLTFSLVVLLVAAAACSVSLSTANISSVKVGKDKAITQEANAFGAQDVVYAAATISNNPGKVKVKGTLVIEDVAGEKPGPIPGAEASVDLPGSGTATFNFSPPANGWPAGKYKLEVVMLNEEGAQKDQKSASFTVS